MKQTLLSVGSGLVIGLLTGIGGFQISIAGDVSETRTELRSLKDELRQEQLRTDGRIKGMAELIGELLRTERELILTMREVITSVRVQYQMTP